MLSDRQIQLLTAIIKEHIDTSQPVGSQIIAEKYKIQCSAATIRNEMARLLDQGFLEMLHTSSGRVPTPMAYRFFLSNLMEEEELQVLQEVALKQKLWPNRFSFDKLLKTAVTAVADTAHQLVLGLTDDNDIYYAGVVNILDYTEFANLETAKALFYVLDRPEILHELFSKTYNTGNVNYLIGEELGNDLLKETGVVFSKFQTGSRSGYISIFGPSHMKYHQIIPAVRYAKELIEELGGSW